MPGTSSAPDRRPGGGFATAAVLVVVYAVAMAYLEGAVVVYLSRALEIRSVFPVQPASSLGNLGAIEVGREAATIVMLAMVGWLAGRTPLERFAWFAVAFGVWDIGYYGWLWVFEGWPSSPGTWDLLFLIPVVWAGPVWAPSAVSVALIGFGLAAARRLRRGLPLRAGRRTYGLAVAGGMLVILSFTVDAAWIEAGNMPRWFPWPLFVGGMALAGGAAWSALGGPRRRRDAPSPDPVTRPAS